MFFETALTFFGHSHFKALLESTVLASIPGDFINNTVLISVTSVNHVLLNTSAEKALRGSKREKLSQTAARRESEASVINASLARAGDAVMAAETLTSLSLKALAKYEQSVLPVLQTREPLLIRARHDRYYLAKGN